MFGAREAKAAPVNWNSFSEIVGSIPAEYSQTYTSTTSSSLPNQCAGILYWAHPTLGNVAIGGFDLLNGNVTLSYFGNVGENSDYYENSSQYENPSKKTPLPVFNFNIGFCF